MTQLIRGGEQRSWKTRPLADFVADTRYGTSEKTNDDQAGTPVLRMGNIQNGSVVYSPLKYLHLGPKDREKLMLRRGDILVNRTNSADLVGKCAVFERDEPFSFASYLIRLRVDSHRANPRLIAALINSPAGRAFMLRQKKQMTGQANVNATVLQTFPVCIPETPEEQTMLLADLDRLRLRLADIATVQRETATEINALLPSILDRAFRGEL